MAYIDQQYLVDIVGTDRLMKLTDDNGAGAIDDDVVNRAIDYAEGLFESYARAGGYALPVPATTNVKALVADLAINRLERKRAKTSEALDMVDKTYKSLERRLNDVSTRKAALDVPAAEETVAKPASADSVLSGPKNEPVFSDRKLGGF